MLIIYAYLGIRDVYKAFNDMLFLAMIDFPSLFDFASNVIFIPFSNMTITATATCTDADDCEDADERCNRDWHCVDGQCRCGFGFGGGPIGGGGGGGGGPGRR